MVSNIRRPCDRKINQYLDRIACSNGKIANTDTMIEGLASTGPDARLLKSAPGLATSSRLPGGPNFHEPVKAPDGPPSSPLSPGILGPDLCPSATSHTSHPSGRCMPAT